MNISNLKKKDFEITRKNFCIIKTVEYKGLILNIKLKRNGAIYYSISNRPFNLVCFDNFTDAIRMIKYIINHKLYD